MSLPLPSLTSAHRASHSNTSSSYFLLHSHQSPSEGSSSSSGALAATVELLTPVGTPKQGSTGGFVISSTVKGSGTSGGSGRIDLLTAFGGGAFLACTFQENTRFVIYAVATQTKQNQSTLPERARALCVDTESRYVMFGSPTGRLRIYSLATGYLVADVRTHHDRGINVLAIDQASRWLVVGGEDGIISVYDFGALIATNPTTATQANSRTQHSNALVLSISEHSLAITTLQISASNMLLTASKDGSVRLYRLEQPIQAASNDSMTNSSGMSTVPSPPCLFHHSFRGIIHAAVLDATESIIYVACKENIHWLSLYTPRPTSAASLPTWSGHNSTVISLALDASSTHLLSVDAEGQVKLWEGCCMAPNNLPNTQGTCLKTLGRRNGCRSVQFVEARSNIHIATTNTHAIQHAPPTRGAGLQTKESGWIFPPLNSSVVAATSSVTAGLLYLPIPLTQSHNVMNHELRNGYLRSALVTSKKRRWCDAALEEVDTTLNTRRLAHVQDDWQLVTGKSGWSSLTESVASRGASLDAIQNQAETYAAHCKDLYQLCLEKVWTEIKTPNPK